MSAAQILFNTQPTSYNATCTAVTATPGRPERDPSGHQYPDHCNPPGAGVCTSHRLRAGIWCQNGFALHVCDVSVHKLHAVSSLGPILLVWTADSLCTTCSGHPQGAKGLAAEESCRVANKNPCLVR